MEQRIHKKNILLVVSGSIAAYKAADLARLFIKAGVNVNVSMTHNGSAFITPITMETLTGNKCLMDTFDRNFQFDVEHISIAKLSDLVIVAPASANIIGKLACGIADDMPTTTMLACTCPFLIAPAMNTNMYNNPVVQRNMNLLRSLGYHFADPADGLLACGDVGQGKLAPVEDIFRQGMALLEAADKVQTNAASCDLEASAAISSDYAGQNLLITAGPTQEPIDPVRYITNHSTGKMGFAIAQAAVRRGAKVTLISGPVNIPYPEGCNVIPVITAAEMADAVRENFPSNDVLIMSAAVADYTPLNVADHKIKKTDGDLSIPLKRTTDILASITGDGALKANQFICGFSMETENMIANSKAKLAKKHLDMIAANSIAEPGAGFAHNTNKLTLITRTGERSLPLMSKLEAADQLLNAILSEQNIKKEGMKKGELS